MNAKTKNRKEILDNFANEESVIKIIFNVNILKEGIDCRSCDAVVFMDDK